MEAGDLSSSLRGGKGASEEEGKGRGLTNGKKTRAIKSGGRGKPLESYYEESSRPEYRGGESSAEQRGGDLVPRHEGLCGNVSK